MNVNIGIHFVALRTLSSCTALKPKQGRRAVGWGGWGLVGWVGVGGVVEVR